MSDAWVLTRGPDRIVRRSGQQPGDQQHPGSRRAGTALHEVVRVLRPGGRLRIVDEGAGRYAVMLRDAGCADVAVRQLDWRTWYGIPGHRMTLVAAAQPPG